MPKLPPGARIVEDDQQTSKAAFQNRGRAGVLGAIPDAVGAGTEFFGINKLVGPVDRFLQERVGVPKMPFEGPLGGSQSIEAGMRLLGMTTPQERDEQPKTMGQSLARGVGEAEASLLPFFGIASRLTKAASPVVRAIGDTLRKGSITAPVTTTALDITSGAASGAGGQVARENFPDNKVAEVIGELLGGLSPALGRAGTKATAKLGVKIGNKIPATRMAIKAAERAALPFTKAGGFERASRSVRSRVADPEGAAAALLEKPIAKVSPATQTGSDDLMALERSVLDSEPKLRAEFKAQTSAAVQKLRGEVKVLGEGGDIAAARNLARTRREGVLGGLEGQREARVATAEDNLAAVQKRTGPQLDRVRTALDTRLKQAGALAEQRIADLPTSARRGAQQVIVREEIEAAETVARASERGKWDLIPSTVKRGTSNAVAAFDARRAELTLISEDKIPGKAFRFLDQDKNSFLGEETTIQELRELRSEMLQVGREARARPGGGDKKLAKSAKLIADGILEDLGATEGTTDDIGRLINDARGFSRDVNDRFTRGSVGRILEKESSGGFRVEPESTLDATVGRGGVKGEVALQQIKQAVNESPGEAMKGIQQFMSTNFVDQAFPNGKFSKTRAANFISNNRETLDHFSELTRRMRSAKTAQELFENAGQVVKSRTGRASVAARQRLIDVERLTKEAVRNAEKVHANRVKNIQNPSISRTSEFLNAPVGDEIAKMVKSDNPQAAARAAIKTASKDPTGAALVGLKDGVADDVINKIATKNFLEDGTAVPSGRALKALLDSTTKEGKNQLKVMNEIIGPAGVKRLRLIANELAKIETSQGGLPKAGEIISDVPSKVISFIGTLFAAKSGARLAGGGGGSGIGSSLKLASEASNNMRELLQRFTTDTAAELIKDSVSDTQLFRALLLNVRPPAVERFVVRRLNAWLAGPGSRVLEEPGEAETSPGEAPTATVQLPPGARIIE